MYINICIHIQVEMWEERGSRIYETRELPFEIISHVSRSEGNAATII